MALNIEPASSALLVARTRSYLQSVNVSTQDHEYGSWRKRLEYGIQDALSRGPPTLIVTETFDWSGTGRGRHVRLNVHEPLPLQIGRLLGNGATSQVHEATCKGLTVAVKRRRIFRHNRVQELSAFEKEHGNMAKVNGHQHVAKIIGTFVHDRVIGILMWPVAVCDLRTFLDDINSLWEYSSDFKPGKFGCVARGEVLRTIGLESFTRLENLRVLFCDNKGQSTLFFAYLRIERSLGCLAGALAYLHGQKMKHKDIKPSNVVLTPDSIYITDFGTSTDFSASNSSVTETGGGTPRYWAPEVANYEPSGRSADVFSLGCIFLEMTHVYYRKPLEILQDYMEDRDHSFQANLGHIMSNLQKDFLRSISEYWVDAGLDESSFLGQGFHDLIFRMMDFDASSRPSALTVLSNLRDMCAERNKKLGNIERNTFFSPCCLHATILC